MPASATPSTPPSPADTSTPTIIPTPAPTETALPGIDADTYETDEYGRTLAIKDGQIVGLSFAGDDGDQITMSLGERGAVMVLDENGNWQPLIIKVKGKVGTQDINPKASGIFPTPHGLIFEGKNDQPSVLLDNDGNIIQLNYAVATLANGEKFVWDKDSKTWQDGFRIGDDGLLRIFQPTSGRYEAYVDFNDKQNIKVERYYPLMEATRFSIRENLWGRPPKTGQ